MRATSQAGGRAGTPAIAVPRAGAQRIDLLNIGIIAAIFATVVLLVSPARDFPMDDDWAYAELVREILNGTFRISPWAQAIALGHIAWASVLASFLGFSYTTLSIANLSVSLFGLVVFYLLLRQLDISPGYALFGVAVLGFNPMYVYLSYSFMTDVGFIAFMLGALLCFVIAFKGSAVRESWLWWGSLACALAYLNRQFGALIPVAVLLYMWVAREWGWRRALAVTLIPMLSAVSYAIWEAMQPAQLVGMILDQMRSFAFEHPGQAMLLRVFDLVYTIAIPGLCLLPLLFLRGRPRYALLAFGLLAALQIYVLRATGTVLPVMGNVVDHTGFFTMSQALWTEWVWAGLAIAGSLTLCLLVASLLGGLRPDALWKALRRRSHAGPPVRDVRDPANITYLLLALLVPVAVFLPPFLFDRYFLPVFPLLIIATLRHLQQRASPSSPSPAWWRWALLVPMAAFSIIGVRDLYEFYAVRWERAEALVASSGVAYHNIDAGYEWIGWHLFDEGERLMRERNDYTHLEMPGEAALDPVYKFSNAPIEGYEQLESIPYRSWLGGGEERHLLLLKRTGD